MTFLCRFKVMEAFTMIIIFSLFSGHLGLFDSFHHLYWHDSATLLWRTWIRPKLE